MKLLTLIATVAFAFAANASEPVAAPAPTAPSEVAAPAEAAPVAKKEHKKGHKKGHGKKAHAEETK